MKKLVVTSFLLIFGLGLLNAQWIYKGNDRERAVPPGKGKEYQRPFMDVGEIHFVQFAVYPGSVNPFELGAPNLGQVWIIYHRETKVKGEYGAFYIVKPFGTADDARRAVARYKNMKYDCWYNSELTGATFNLIGTTTDSDGDKAIGVK